MKLRNIAAFSFLAVLPASIWCGWITAPVPKPASGIGSAASQQPLAVQSGNSLVVLLNSSAAVNSETLALDIAALSFEEAKEALELLWAAWIPASYRHQELADRLIEHMASIDPFKTFAVGERHSWPWSRATCFVPLVSAMVRSNPDRTEAILKAMSARQVKTEAYDAASKIMAETDLRRGYQWAREGGSSGELFIREWAQQDPQGAAALVAEVPALLLDPQVVADVFERLWNSNAAVAETWLAELPTGSPASKTALASMANILAETDPERAVHVVLSQNGFGESRLEVLSNVFKRWRQQDEQQAFAAAAQLQAGPLREGVVLNLLVEAAAEHPEKLGELQGQFVSASSLDKFCSSFVDSVAPSKPEAAATAVAAIEDEEVRRAQLNRVGFLWAHRELSELTRYATQARPDVRHNLLEGAAGPLLRWRFDYALNWIESLAPDLQKHLLSNVIDDPNNGLTEDKLARLANQLRN